MKFTASLSLLFWVAGCTATAPPPATSTRTAEAAGAESSGAPNSPVGESWRVVSYFDGERAMAHPILGAEIDAVFGADGRVAGSAGCNNYSAAYRIEASGIAIGPVAATRRFCAEPPGVMEQETRYLEALQSATTLRRDAESMQLRTAQDSLAVYLKRQGSEAPPR